MKERVHNKDTSKNRKSQQSFFCKPKPQSPLLNEQFKFLNKKKQPRISTSCLEIHPSFNKNELRSVGSLEINPGELSIVEERPSRSTNNKSKKHIGHCFSERNIVVNPSQSRLFKYRKFSSNAELKQEQEQQHKRRLSLAQERPDLPDMNSKTVTKKLDKLSVTTWLILIRKLFVDEHKRRNSNSVKLNSIVNYIYKLERTGFQEFSLMVEPLQYEAELTKDQLVATLQHYFMVPKNQLKDAKNSKDLSLKVTFLEFNNCIIQYQLKTAANVTCNPKHKSSSSEEHEEAVETARFQQGNADDLRRVKKHSQTYKLQPEIIIVPHFQTVSLKEKGKENIRASLNVTDNSNLYSNASNRSRQSLNPSLSPFAINESKSIGNSRFSLEQQSNQSLVFKKGALHCHEQSLGMLTLQGRSPRELMQSQIYESMQRLGVTAQRNNISFSIEQLQCEPHISFEQTVRSFEQILRKIKNIQGHYKGDNFQEGGRPQQKNTDEVNDFLEQLINYRMSMVSDKTSLEDSYSYFVGVFNIGRFKVHNEKIMSALLQSAYMREYFAALEGIKIDNSPQLLRLVAVHLHHNLRILNISNNGISDASFIMTQISDENVLEILNINNNAITNIDPFLKKFSNLRELHCKSNAIREIASEHYCPHLKIIDLSHNKIAKSLDLAGLIHIKSLSLVNLPNNPVVEQPNWKSLWSGPLNINLIYEMDNLYVMSAYGHQKDIAFSKENTINIDRKISIEEPYKNSEKGDENRQYSSSLVNRELRSQVTKLTPKYASRQQKQPAKHKISKIKTYLDGKII